MKHKCSSQKEKQSPINACVARLGSVWITNLPFGYHSSRTINSVSSDERGPVRVCVCVRACEKSRAISTQVLPLNRYSERLKAATHRAHIVQRNRATTTSLLTRDTSPSTLRLLKGELIIRTLSRLLQRRITRKGECAY